MNLSENFNTTNLLEYLGKFMSEKLKEKLQELIKDLL